LGSRMRELVGSARRSPGPSPFSTRSLDSTRSTKRSVLFNSYLFLFFFLPITWIGHEILLRMGLRRASMGWLVLASGIFYATWNPQLLLLLVASLLVNFQIGRWLTDLQSSGAAGEAPTNSSRPLLTLGVVFNLGLLGYFKYANFFVDNLNAGFGMGLVLNQIVLPIGISFFTFQEIAFLVDSHRGEAGRKRFLDFALFVTFFPQLIAGPIVHYSEVMPQFEARDRKPASDRLAVGLTILVMGLVKKLVIADTMEVPATALFDAVARGHDPALIESWAATLAYTLQIYFDFSGYSDMAIGLGFLFGICLPVNFASPYKADSITDFWRRWHITLSRFLKDYLYFSLGGNRRGKTRTYSNLFLTMLLGGIWHGAAWTFALWGGLHGFLLIVHRLWQGDPKAPRRRLPKWGGRLLTFGCVILAWVPFRSPDIPSTISVYRGLFGFNGIVLPEDLASKVGALPGMSDVIQVGALGVEDPGNLALWLVALIFAVSFLPNTHEWMADRNPALPTRGYPATNSASVAPLFSWRPNVRYGLALAVALFICVVKLNDVSPFIYFQF
jgi:alginate O-acetyltransferase complex protein AlgI